jgi:hypothetical protein
MGGFCSMGNIGSWDSELDALNFVNVVNITDKMRMVLNDLSLYNANVKRNSAGMEFYVVLPDEFKMYCDWHNFNVTDLRLALKNHGLLYLERNSECTRNVRVNGKQQRCLCVYKGKGVTGKRDSVTGE